MPGVKDTKEAEHSKQPKSGSVESGPVKDDKDYISLPQEKYMSETLGYSGRFRHDYFEPSLEQAKAFSVVYPVLSTFITFFSLISFIPVVCFLGTSLFILGTFIFASLTLAILAAIVIIAILGIALLGVLFLISVLSLCFTALAISTFVGVRLFVLLRTQSSFRAGIAQWLRELKGHIYVRLPQSLKYPKEQNPASAASRNDTESYDMKTYNVDEKDVMNDEAQKGMREMHVKTEG